MDESVCSCHVSTRQEQGSPELLNSLTVWPRASICNHLITSTLKPKLLFCRFTTKKIHYSVWEGLLSLFREGLLNGRPRLLMTVPDESSAIVSENSLQTALRTVQLRLFLFPGGKVRQELTLGTQCILGSCETTAPTHSMLHGWRGCL